MLLFVQKRFSDLIKSGKKTLEIRFGNRYRNIQVKQKLSINGHFKVTVINVKQFKNKNELIEYSKHHYKQIGLKTPNEINILLNNTHPNHPGPFFCFHIFKA